MKRAFLVTLAVATVAIGCSDKGSKGSHTFQEQPSFTMDPADVEKLQGVGCEVKEVGLECVEIKSQSQSLEHLELKKQKVQDRMKVLGEVLANIKSKVDQIEFDLMSEINAEVLISQLSSLEARTVVQAALVGGEVVQKKNFETTFGYSCRGQFARGTSVATWSEILSFNVDKKDQTVALKNQNGTDIAGYIKTSPMDGTVILSAADSAESGQQELLVFVKSASEFKWNSKSALGDLETNCVKARASGTSDKSVLTDLAKETRVLKCVADLVKEIASGEKMHRYLKTEKEFSVDDLKRGENLDFSWDKKDFNELDPKFGARMESSEGVLKVLVTSGQAQIAEFTTMNSNPSFEVLVRDFKNNAVRVRCQ